MKALPSILGLTIYVSLVVGMIWARIGTIPEAHMVEWSSPIKAAFILLLPAYFGYNIGKTL